MTSDLKIALDAAAKACDAVKTGYSQNFATEHKKDNSLVTSIDQEAERMIITHLQQHSPHAILSEESGAIPGHGDLTWVIDPIDGTTNFARHHLPFAVSIALMEGEKSIIGVIQNPLTNECFYAAAGHGAFLDGERIGVSANADPSQSILFFNFGAHRDDRQRIVQVVESLIYEFDIRTWGTTAWELCTVAKGTSDAFICVGDKLWDYAAGMCIVQEAGGRFTDWCGAPWNLSHSYVLAANPHIQPRIMEKIRHLQNIGRS